MGGSTKMMRLLFLILNLRLHLCEPRRDKRHTPFLPGDHWNGKRPDFGPTNTSVNVITNGTAIFKCPIAYVEDSGISFVRREDYHILSNGHNLYTSDKRIEIIHAEKSNDWILRIKRVSQQDSGVYECQVSTPSGSYALSFKLTVVTPRALILGMDDGGEFHIDPGSDFTLTCVIPEAPSAPQYVFWYHEDRMVNYENKNGIKVQTVTRGGTNTTSKLSIIDASREASGNYTCKPANAISASVQVFISQDRKSEPLLRSNSKKTSSSSSSNELSSISSSSSGSSNGISSSSSSNSLDHHPELASGAFPQGRSWASASSLALLTVLHRIALST